MFVVSGKCFKQCVIRHAMAIHSDSVVKTFITLQPYVIRILPESEKRFKTVRMPITSVFEILNFSKYSLDSLYFRCFCQNMFIRLSSYDNLG